MGAIFKKIRFIASWSTEENTTFIILRDPSNYTTCSLDDLLVAFPWV